MRAVWLALAAVQAEGYFTAFKHLAFFQLHPFSIERPESHCNSWKCNMRLHSYHVPPCIQAHALPRSQAQARGSLSTPHLLNASTPLPQATPMPLRLAAISSPPPTW